MNVLPRSHELYMSNFTTLAGIYSVAGSLRTAVIKSFGPSFFQAVVVSLPVAHYSLPSQTPGEIDVVLYSIPMLFRRS